MKYISSGESHGESLMGILEGVPSNLKIDEEFINGQLKKRQMGYGRSERMEIESDRVKIISGINNGYSTGNPIGLLIDNKATNIKTDEIYRVRPGHGDLVGGIKYNHPGGRNVLERASARETAMRVAIGSICKLLLREVGIVIYGHVIQIGSISSSVDYYSNLDLNLLKAIDKSDLRIIDRNFEEKALGEIEEAKKRGDTLGGRIEIIVRGMPIGIGSHTTWEQKLDGLLAQAVLSLQAMKSFEIGRGAASASFLGSHYQDEIYFENGLKRRTNNAGGIEAGISNGEDIVIRTSMKPIPTTKIGLETVDLRDFTSQLSTFERSDNVAVSSASLILENVVAYTLAREILKKCGGDSMEEFLNNYRSYRKYVGDRLGY